MLFPDETNLRHVAAALWNNPNGIGQASLIVGAGFSKNATHRAGSEGSSAIFPSWAELTHFMVDELYAHETSKDRRKRKTGASGGVSNALRVAEEYEAARGRGHLDSLLKKAIPDLDFEPSSIHNALCELPWADILTTNYDTLLERAARKQLKRKYQPVLSQQDIPTTQQPRIIKLHGSFPESKQPFVITEEDFRTYEGKFPAMVNLAQQCLAEKTCCLVGFSGDDPNFLRWSGWVRDVLGHSHMQPVYLVGLHDHSPSQKSLLDRRHVHTIDLSPLFPKEQWPDAGKRHSAATTWFIQALKELKPTETIDWPEASTEAFTNLPLSASVARFPANNATKFQDEYSYPHSNNLDDEIVTYGPSDDIRELSEAERREKINERLKFTNERNSGHRLDKKIEVITSIWKNNRSLYPGWLVIPWSNQKKLVHSTSTWLSIIPERVLEKDDKEEASGWLSELAWRLDCALQPWPAKMITAVKSCINLDDLESDGNGNDITLALELLRAFREDGRSKEFLELRDKLSGLRKLPSDGSDFISQQAVLFHLESWRIKDALSELQNWDTSAASAIWKARKAALLGEFRPDVALDETLQALTNLQNSPDLNDLYTRSREANVLWLATVLTARDQDERQDYDGRRRVIQRKVFDAFNFEDRLNETLQDPPRADLESNDQQDPRVSTQVRRAYSMRRYIEHTAGLIGSPGVTVYANRVKNAVPWMAISDPEEALRLSVRQRDSSDRGCTFPKHMLAALGRQTISDQILGVLSTVQFLIVEIGRHNRYRPKTQKPEPSDLLDDANRNDLLRATISHGSFLWPVLSIEQRTDFIRTVLNARTVASSFEWQTIDRIESALHDLLPNLSEREASELAPALIMQPLAGIKGFPRSPWTNARDIIVSASSETLDGDREQHAQDHIELENTLDKLLELQEDTERFEIAWTATLRLAFAARQKLLSTDQIETLVTNIEIQLKYIVTNIETTLNCAAFHPVDLLGIPVGNKIHYRKMAISIILKMPWPEFLQRDAKGETTSIRYLGPYKDPSSLAVDLTNKPWQNNQHFLYPEDWSLDQVMTYLSHASNWLDKEAAALVKQEQKDTNGSFYTRGQLTWRCETICQFCNNIVIIGHSDKPEVVKTASALVENIYGLLPHLPIKYAPTLLGSGLVPYDQMAVRIREIYACTDSMDKFTALMAILVWATTAKYSEIDPPPSALVTEIAVIIRTRREPDLGWALDIARILIKRCSELIESVFYDEVLLGLSYLAEETKPTTPASSVFRQKATLTQLRVASLRLLAELPGGKQRQDVVSQWLLQSEGEVDLKVFQAIEELKKHCNGFDT